ncbi:threonine aldolase family protein [Intestinibacter sp.]|uniref:threonine aldolase family protein n=1 Tax=Intestinibacter sp. TaxID=1965304 RepID=UPI002A754597|nr:low specificity L-threonine aldolase [Intestinibacter sp.]MDY2734750.1 low specificity L-threonine aldolase [Intestinibacter sp.]
MLYFENDYSEGAHGKVLEALVKTNYEKLSGYGTDDYCEKAKEKIKAACKCDDAEVYLLVGGTQTNQLIIDTTLNPYEGVVAVETGHVGVHEAGAIEYTGHKVLTVPAHDGKMDAGELNDYLETFYNDGNHEHMVFPGMVYISHPTEYGTLYTKDELEKISKVCNQYKIPLYLDGARLGYGIMSKDTDVDLPTVAKYCDIFYIGGTKVGALCGEAVVFTKNNMPKHFTTQVKQHGALLAKGRLLGVQFDALFTDDLYLEISKNAIEMAELLKKGLAEKGYRFYLDSPTNQQFIILENNQMEEIAKNVRFSFWEKYDDTHTVVRFATSWATSKEDVEALIDLL